MPNRATLKWSGHSQMNGLLGAYEKELRVDCTGPRGVEIKQVLMNPAERIAAIARQLVPVKTGNLRDAIFTSIGPPGSSRVIAGVSFGKAFYGSFVEYGTSVNEAQPFFRPAVAQVEADFAATIAPGVKDVIESIAADHAYTPPK